MRPKNFPLFVLAAAALSLLAGQQAALAGTDVQGVYIGVGIGYFDGLLTPNPYEFTMAFLTGPGISSIAFTPPGKSQIPVPYMGDGFEYGQGSYGSLAQLQADFPAGNYLITFNGGADSVTLNYTVPAWPTGIANITYPLNNQMDVPLKPTFTWTSCQGLGQNIEVGVYMQTFSPPQFQYQGSDMSLPITATSWTPANNLLADAEGWLGVEVRNENHSTQVTVGGTSFDYAQDASLGNEIMCATTSPEPATLSLLVIGAAGMFARRRRKS